MDSKLKKALVVLIGGFVAVSAVVYVVNNGFAAPAPLSHEDKEEPKQMSWSFDGPFGTYDRQAAQRGYKVYKEVCSSCHSMNLVSFRNLTELGFSDAEVKSIAADYKYPSTDDAGEPSERNGTPSDKFKAPYANKDAAVAANGAAPPDLSLVLKAREDGANYIYSLLTGYEAAPAGFELNGKHYNPYFPNRKISMPQPLQGGQVDYQDGVPNTLEQEAKDVVQFLHWTAEPKMELRKKIGIKVMAFLAIMTVFFYIAKVRIWARVK